MTPVPNRRGELAEALTRLVLTPGPVGMGEVLGAMALGVLVGVAVCTPRERKIIAVRRRRRRLVRVRKEPT